MQQNTTEDSTFELDDKLGHSKLHNTKICKNEKMDFRPPSN